MNKSVLEKLLEKINWRIYENDLLPLVKRVYLTVCKSDDTESIKEFIEAVMDAHPYVCALLFYELLSSGRISGESRDEVIDALLSSYETKRDHMMKKGDILSHDKRVWAYIILAREVFHELGLFCEERLMSDEEFMGTIASKLHTKESATSLFEFMFGRAAYLPSPYEFYFAILVSMSELLSDDIHDAMLSGLLQHIHFEGETLKKLIEFATNKVKNGEYHLYRTLSIHFDGINPSDICVTRDEYIASFKDVRIMDLTVGLELAKDFFLDTTRSELNDLYTDIFNEYKAESDEEKETAKLLEYCLRVENTDNNHDLIRSAVSKAPSRIDGNLVVSSESLQRIMQRSFLCVIEAEPSLIAQFYKNTSMQYLETYNLKFVNSVTKHFVAQNVLDTVVNSILQRKANSLSENVDKIISIYMHSFMRVTIPFEELLDVLVEKTPKEMPRLYNSLKHSDIMTFVIKKLSIKGQETYVLNFYDVLTRRAVLLYRDDLETLEYLSFPFPVDVYGNIVKYNPEKKLLYAKLNYEVSFHSFIGLRLGGNTFAIAQTVKSNDTFTSKQKKSLRDFLDKYERILYVQKSEMQFSPLLAAWIRMLADNFDKAPICNYRDTILKMSEDNIAKRHPFYETKAERDWILEKKESKRLALGLPQGEHISLTKEEWKEYLALSIDRIPSSVKEQCTPKNLSYANHVLSYFDLTDEEREWFLRNTPLKLRGRL